MVTQVTSPRVSRPPLRSRAGDGSVTPPKTHQLADWLTDLRTRGATITINPRGNPRVTGGTPLDQMLATHYTHALTIAAAGTHPHWWDYLLGRTATPPDLDDIPTAPTDPDAFACICCGAPADRIDQYAAATCTEHTR